MKPLLSLLFLILFSVNCFSSGNLGNLPEQEREINNPLQYRITEASDVLIIDSHHSDISRSERESQRINVWTRLNKYIS